MNYQASNPSDYPVGEMVKLLPKDVRDWVLAQSLDTKSHLDIHQLMLKARIEMGLPPWHMFTAVMQAYAAAAFEETGERPDITCSWFACGKQPRPLDIYNHKYEDTHEIWVHMHTGEDILVGYIVGRYDGRPVFSFWDVRTERYWSDCTRSMTIFHPYTREAILTNYGLAKWRDHIAVDGRAILPEMTRRSGKKKGKVNKDDAPTEPLPNPVATLSEASANIRLTLLKLFQSVIDRRIITNRVLGSSDVDADMFSSLCGVLRNALDIYIDKLEKRDVTTVHIPDAAYLACQTTVEILKNAEGLGSALRMWMEQLTKTDTTRG